MIRIGPAGLGPVKTAEKVLEEYSGLGFKACEIAFTYGPYIKEKEAKSIGRVAKKFGIKLSIHAPYWVNLNSKEKKKIKDTKKRILDCCKIGEVLGAEVVVFHPGYYGENREKAHEKISEGIRDMMRIVKGEKWKIKLAPETMGKVNVFGSVEEIAGLVKETGCFFCIDFAHILARDKKVDMKKIKRLFPQKNWHCHFSGIVYGEKGERHHKKTSIEEWKWLKKMLPKNKNITIINESPSPVDDCVEGLEVLEN